jgi:nucleoid-associated protein YgaU
MTKTEEAAPTTDPFEVWRGMYDASEKAWSSALEQAMGTPEFGESSGKLLETMLAAQKSVRSGMRAYLEAMNVPTREDIARLGELVTGLEEKIDQVADRLDVIEEAMNVPTRDELARLGVLVAGLETKIDRRHALEDELRTKAAASARAATARAAAQAKATTEKARAATAAARTAAAAARAETAAKARAAKAAARTAAATARAEAAAKAKAAKATTAAKARGISAPTGKGTGTSATSPR